MNEPAPLVEPNPDAPDYSGRPLAPDRLSAIEEFAGPSVLDVGCGNGAYVLRYADRFAIRGVDYQRFDSWNRRPELFSLGDAGKLDQPDSSVDTILSFETLEHLPDPRTALVEYLRVCRRNVILTVPNCALTPGMRASGIIYNHWVDRTHLNFWDLESISALVREVGFAVKVARPINQISMGSVVAESLGLGGFLARTFARGFRVIARPRYHMTTLVVCEKPSRNP